MNWLGAQGAEHTTQENLKKIVDIINEQRMHFDPDRGNIFSRTLDICREYGHGCFDKEFIDNYSFVVNTGDYSVEEKYDGFSYLNIEGKFFSKRLSDAKGSEGMPIEKTGHIPHISNILKSVYEQCGCDLHGEIYIPGGISDDVTKILGCAEDKARSRILAMSQDKMPRYMLIDIRGIYGKSLINETHRVRRAMLQYVYYKFIQPNDPMGYIKLTENKYGDPRDEFRRIVLAGGEGIIIKREDALYIPGKKPANNWIKGKKKVTTDVVIMGFNDGTGKNKSLFGSIKFGMMIDNKLVACGSCSSGLNDNTRSMIAQNPESYIGTVMEIEAIQESVKSFRNAVFLRLRDDKGASECTPINMKIKENLI